MSTQNQIPGSIDDGAIDTEFSPRLSDADQTYATRQQMTDMAERMADFEQRLRVLENQATDQGGNIRHLQRTARILDTAHKKWREDDRENDFWAYVMESVGVVDEREANREPVPAHNPADTVIIPPGAWEDIQLELEALRAFKARVGDYTPWRWDDEMAEYQCVRCNAILMEGDCGSPDLETYAHLHKPTCPWYEPKEEAAE